MSLKSACLLASLTLQAQSPPPTAFIRTAAVDSKGFIYLAGEISGHGVVSKYTPAGDELLWLTNFGGDGRDSISKLVVAPDGDLVFTGTTTSKNLFPFPGGYQTKPAGIFLAKLTADGESLLAGTYLGGEGSDIPAALKVDASGNVYVAGEANSRNFPTTPGAYQTQRITEPRGACTLGTAPDMFVAKFNPSLSSALFSTLIGGPGRDTASDLALGADDSIFVAGTEGTERGPCQAYSRVTRLTSDGSVALYAGSFPGTPTPWGAYTIAVDSEGNAYIGSDNRAWPLARPDGEIRKLDPRGNIVSSQPIAGRLASMSVSTRGELVITGTAITLLEARGRGFPSCAAPGDSTSEAPFVSRLNSSTLAATYTGFLSDRQVWLVSPEQLVAAACPRCRQIQSRSCRPDHRRLERSTVSPTPQTTAPSQLLRANWRSSSAGRSDRLSRSVPRWIRAATSRQPSAECPYRSTASPPHCCTHLPIRSIS